MEAKTNQYVPKSVSHLGRTLEAKLEELKMSTKEFALRTSKSEEIINSVLTGNIAITLDMAVLFEEVLSIPTHFWLSRQNNYDKAVTKSKNNIA